MVILWEEPTPQVSFPANLKVFVFESNRNCCGFTKQTTDSSIFFWYLNESIKRKQTQGNCATEGNSGNCHSRERWMRKPSIHGGKWKSNEGIDNIANGPVNVFKHCGRPNHLSKCAWKLNCHCGWMACSSTSPHYGNCHYGTSHGGIISLWIWYSIRDNKSSLCFSLRPRVHIK